MLFVYSTQVHEKYLEQLEASAEPEYLGGSLPLTHCQLLDPSRFCGEVAKRLGVEESDAPVVFILRGLKSVREKFKMNVGSRLDPLQLKEFYTAYKSGVLDPYLISEDEPTHQHHDYLHRLVASTCKSLVMQSSYDVVVLFESD